MEKRPSDSFSPAGWLGGPVATTVILVVFFVLRIGLPIIYSGSYVDEYLHIFSGMEFLETGTFAEIYDGSLYTRGAPVSLLVAALFGALGASLFVAKLVAVLFSAVSFFAFIKLTSLILPKHAANAARLFVAFSPWLIFNHFYIRMYVYYEAATVLTALLLVLAWRAAKQGNIRKWSAFSIGALILLAVVFFFSNDLGRYPVVLFGGTGLAWAFVFGGPRGASDSPMPFRWPTYVRATLIALLAAAAMLAFDIGSKLDILRSAALEFTAPSSRRYDWFFLGANAVLTVFVLFALLNRKSWLNSLVSPVIAGFATIAVLHALSAPDLQLLRGVLYALPLFYLACALGVAQLRISVGRQSLLLLLLLVPLFAQYPPRFWSGGPQIPGEVYYIDYERTYDRASELREELDTSVLVGNPSPFIALFYGVRPDFAVITRPDLYTNILRQGLDGRLETVMGAIPVLTNVSEMQQNTRPPRLFVHRVPSAPRVAPEQDVAILLSDAEVEQFEGIRIYIQAPSESQ